MISLLRTVETNILHELHASHLLVNNDLGVQLLDNSILCTVILLLLLIFFHCATILLLLFINKRSMHFLVRC